MIHTPRSQDSNRRLAFSRNCNAACGRFTVTTESRTRSPKLRQPSWLHLTSPHLTVSTSPGTVNKYVKAAPATSQVKINRRQLGLNPFPPAKELLHLVSMGSFQTPPLTTLHLLICICIARQAQQRASHKLLLGLCGSAIGNGTVR